MHGGDNRQDRMCWFIYKLTYFEQRGSYMSASRRPSNISKDTIKSKIVIMRFIFRLRLLSLMQDFTIILFQCYTSASIESVDLFLNICLFGWYAISI